jgi:thiol-disulfide isomerase/thioredoxin
MGLLLAALLLGALPAAAQPGGEDLSQFAGNPRYPAPDFIEGLDWVNVPAPLSLEALRGKVVLLDFWTYGCINCIHMIPVLERLEEKYGDALVVIGVHSAKFANEGRTENIRQIVQRYNLKHPVINDSAFFVWNSYGRYGVNAWPTFVLIDPRGNIFAVQAGEIPFEAFDRVIGSMVAYFDSLDEINRDPLPLALEGANQPGFTLAFPGKVLADAAGGRLFIADTNHHRIVIADLTTYEVLDVIGSGARGLTDGAYEAAQFNKPHGLALSADGLLYVADTENHALRAVDLGARTVSTVAGTGVQGYERQGSFPALAVNLSSPWDVALGENNLLYVAMAGTHQIWRMKLDEGVIEAYIGSGREGLKDDTLAASELAQPSGLYYRDGVLVFADSESSSIRAADLAADRVVTLAGPAENNLFRFGDVDGAVGESRLQHALAVVGLDDGRLAVADTYNSKIKLLDAENRVIESWLGRGSIGGFRDGGAAEVEFDEPGGLAFANGRLYVADTNNHAIRVIEVATATVSTVVFPNPEALQIGERVTVVGGNAAAGEQISLEAQTVAPGAGEIVLKVTLPQGYKLNPDAIFSAEWSAVGAAVSIAVPDRLQRIAGPELPLRVPVMLSEGEGRIHGELTIFYCEAIKEELCFIDRVGLDAPVVVSAGAPSSEITLERIITPPAVVTGGL